MAERRLGWLGPDREVCDASSPLFVFGFFCSFPLFFSLIAEKNTCRFGAMILDFFPPCRYYKHKHTKIYTDVHVMIVFAWIISTRGCT
jgi:hypothetical protein